MNECQVCIFHFLIDIKQTNEYVKFFNDKFSFLAELATPLRWKSELWETWYFENQIKSNIWIEFYDRTVQANYTQISMTTDKRNGNVTVILMKRKDFFIKLSQGFWCYLNDNPKSYCVQTSPGYWLVKKG